VYDPTLHARLRVLADQYAWITREQAREAASYLASGTVFLDYCRPCGDVYYKKHQVAQVEVSYTGTEQYYQVKINGRGKDLAYTYVYHQGYWTNLAWVLGLKASDVPFYLLLPADPSARLMLASREVFEEAPPHRDPSFPLYPPPPTGEKP